MDLLIKLKLSKLYMASILASAAVGLLGIVMVASSFLTYLFLLVVWLLGSFWAVQTWLQSPTSLRLRTSALDIEVLGQSYAMTSARVLPFLLCFPSTEGAPSVLIWRDSVAGREWRQLRMWLKIHSI